MNYIIQKLFLGLILSVFISANTLAQAPLLSSKGKATKMCCKITNSNGCLFYTDNNDPDGDPGTGVYTLPNRVDVFYPLDYLGPKDPAAIPTLSGQWMVASVILTFSPSLCLDDDGLPVPGCTQNISREMCLSH